MGRLLRLLECTEPPATACWGWPNVAVPVRTVSQAWLSSSPTTPAVLPFHVKLGCHSQAGQSTAACWKTHGQDLAQLDQPAGIRELPLPADVQVASQSIEHEMILGLKGEGTLCVSSVSLSWALVG